MSSEFLIRMSQIVKSYPAPQPLRIADLSVAASDRIVLSGLDDGAAEMFVHLVTGAAVPDEGGVTVSGRNTRDISTDTEWLTSLDQFGIVTRRAVLLDSLSVAANLALPLTLAIDPMSVETRARAASDAAEVGLAADRLDGPVAALSDLERVRLHLARAAANGPQLVLLEHPTAGLGPADAEHFGAALRAFSNKRRFGFLALSDDDRFAKATGATRLGLDSKAGTIGRAGSWWGRIWR